MYNEAIPNCSGVEPLVIEMASQHIVHIFEPGSIELGGSFRAGAIRTALIDNNVIVYHLTDLDFFYKTNSSIQSYCEEMQSFLLPDGAYSDSVTICIAWDLLIKHSIGDKLVKLHQFFWESLGRKESTMARYKTNSKVYLSTDLKQSFYQIDASLLPYEIFKQTLPVTMRLVGEMEGDERLAQKLREKFSAQKIPGVFFVKTYQSSGRTHAHLMAYFSEASLFYCSQEIAAEFY